MKLGISSFITEPIYNLPYYQRDTCEMLNLLKQMKNQISSKNSNNINYTDWYQNLVKNDGQRTLISKYFNNLKCKTKQKYSNF